MKTKNIFKTLAFAMLMPAMLLTTACSNEDDNLINNENNEIVKQEGFTIPITINVTRQGDDATTRANYNESSKKLEFTTGDQLWIRGENNSSGGAGVFTALLTWQSGGTFRGNLYTQNEYKGTADALLTVATNLQAFLLPAGYSTYGFLSFYEGLVESHNAILAFNDSKAFALTKAEAVEQFAFERATSYTSGTGFALTPTHPICSFTITGLAPSTNVAVNYDSPYAGINENVITDASGKATFALAAAGCTDINQFTLTVAGKAITLGNHELEAGKIYNITREAPAPSLADAFVAGNTTVINFSDQITFTATYNGGSFGTTTVGGSQASMVTAQSMEKDGDNLVINVQVFGGQNGSMTINTVYNTYKWSNSSVAGYIPALSAITIGGNSITPLPYRSLSAATLDDYGKVVCAAGHLHDANNHVPSGCTAVGIIGKMTGIGHGLILAMKDAKMQTWNTINGWESVTAYAGTTLKLLPDDTARQYLISYTALGETAVSNWCVANKGSYETIFTNLGSVNTNETGTSYDDNVNSYLILSGGNGLTSTYWSATEDGDLSWVFNRSDCWGKYNKAADMYVRPVLGF